MKPRSLHLPRDNSGINENTELLRTSLKTRSVVREERNTDEERTDKLVDQVNSRSPHS